jgi:hypothetical protein
MTYFKCYTTANKNACILSYFRGFAEIGEFRMGRKLAKQRTEPYTCRMDPEHKKKVRLTDVADNDQSVLVAAPRLQDFLVKQLGKEIELLPVHILDHKERVASKEYAIINILNLQDALAVEASNPDWSTMGPTPEIAGVQQIVVDVKRIDPKARMFRLTQYTRPTIVSEDFYEALKAEKFEGLTFLPVETL